LDINGNIKTINNMQEEIKIHEKHYITDESKIKASLCICLWHMEHLLIRSIETYVKQDMPVEDWELIIVSDNSMGDITPILDYAKGKINIQYIRLEHNYGMRGNTAAFNLAFKMAKGHILMETTAETMFTTNMVRVMYEPHLANDRCFVAIKTYNLTMGDQLRIDTVDWRSDLMNIKNLPDFNSPWTQNNVANTNFGTHQTCSIRKEVFNEIFHDRGFPLYGDYGSEDPHYHGVRMKNKVQGITIMDPMAVHQWHPPFHYWMAKGYAPHFNKFAHSTSNFMNDTTGEVPEGGTRFIWDGGSDEQMTEEEKLGWLNLDQAVRDTGCKIV